MSELLDETAPELGHTVYGFNGTEVLCACREGGWLPVVDYALHVGAKVRAADTPPPDPRAHQGHGRTRERTTMHRHRRALINMLAVGVTTLIVATPVTVATTTQAGAQTVQQNGGFKGMG